ncbi:hypothetical protein CQ10_24340 [Bradyrhizobium valentinum]|uniref:Uncharacterized protein n=1 Tax=Bradyrhizobium valentinum TaxID=1518501 RepID=A0A0R3KX62_9BRAD|nr:hypothetical protein CQ10_24340 [Bradyrhizobium valentinum]KRR02121.1 hypothetical protein CP49_04915 [Bradyrhizobium valentinum]
MRASRLERKGKSNCPYRSFPKVLKRSILAIESPAVIIRCSDTLILLLVVSSGWIGIPEFFGEPNGIV